MTDEASGADALLDRAQRPYRLARGLLERGEHEAAIEALREALRTLTAAPGQAGPVAIVLDALAVALTRSGAVAQAVQARREAARLLEAEPERTGQAAENAHALAILCFQSGAVEEAEAAYRLAIARYRSTAQAEGPLALALHGLGTLLTVSGEAGEAADCFTEAADLLSSIPEAQGARSDVLRSLAALSRGLGRLEEADSVQRRAVELLEPLGDPVSSAEALRELGVLRLEAGAPERAIEPLRAAALAGEEVPEGEAALARTLLLLGRALREIGRDREAEAVYRRGLRAAEADPLARRLPSFRAALGRLHLDAGEPSAAREHLEEAERLFREQPEATAEHAQSCLDLAAARRALGDPAGAVAGCARAAELSAQVPGALRAQADANGTLALALMEAGRPWQAQRAAAEAVHALRRLPGAEAERALGLQRLGGIALAAGEDPREVEAVYREALLLYRELFGSETEQARVLLGICLARQERGLPEQAAQACAEGLDVLRVVPEAEAEAEDVRAQLQQRLTALRPQ